PGWHRLAAGIRSPWRILDRQHRLWLCRLRPGALLLAPDGRLRPAVGHERWRAADERPGADARQADLFQQPGGRLPEPLRREGAGRNDTVRPADAESSPAEPGAAARAADCYKL